MPAPQRFNPIHQIEYWKETGNPADPDSEVREVLIGRANADRKDVRGQEINAQGGTYFKNQTVYTVRAAVRATLPPPRGGGQVRTFGFAAVGYEPLGIPESGRMVTMGSDPQQDWIVRDPGRRGRRYRITGITQSGDMRYYRLTTEQVK